MIGQKIPNQHDGMKSSFSCKYVFTRYKTQTTIVSDSIDVAAFFN